MWNRNEQTICAVSTPDGVGGIAVIRVSGKEALSISRKISKSLQKKSLIESHRVYFSDVVDLRGAKIDEAVFTFFAEGKSFTGEEVVEISCHGSPRTSQSNCSCMLAALSFRLDCHGVNTNRSASVTSIPQTPAKTFSSELQRTSSDQTTAPGTAAVACIPKSTFALE